MTAWAEAKGGWAAGANFFFPRARQVKVIVFKPEDDRGRQGTTGDDRVARALQREGL